MKLIEHRIHGKLYFNTKYFLLESTYQIPFERECKVRSIVLRNDNVLSYLRFKITDTVPRHRFYDVELKQVTDMSEVKSGDSILWAINVSCWESAWEKLKKLPWVKYTEEVIEL